MYWRSTKIKDPTIKLLYSNAKESALKDANQGGDPKAALIIKYENLKQIFENIKTVNSDTPDAFEIIQRHAETVQAKYKNILIKSVPYENTEDFEYVQFYQRHNQGKKIMSWKTCFLKGKIKKRCLQKLHNISIFESPPTVASKPHLNATIKLFSGKLQALRWGTMLK